MNTQERKKAHVLRLLTNGELSVPEASAQPGITLRHHYRLKAAYLRDGDAALIHGPRGEPSNFF